MAEPWACCYAQMSFAEAGLAPGDGAARSELRVPLDFSKFKRREIHVAFANDVQSEEVSAFGEFQFSGIFREVPMMPLPPGNWVSRIVGRENLDRIAGGFAVDIEGNLPAAIGGVEDIDGVDSVLGDIDREIEPFTRFGPPDVEKALWRSDEVVRAVVGADVAFGVGGIDAFVVAELVEVLAVEGVQMAAAKIFRGGIVVSDSFAAGIVVSAHDCARDFLWTAIVSVISEGSAGIVGRSMGRRRRGDRRTADCYERQDGGETETSDEPTVYSGISHINLRPPPTRAVGNGAYGTVGWGFDERTIERHALRLRELD